MVNEDQIRDIVAAHIDQHPHAYRDQWGGGVVWVGPRPSVEELAVSLAAVAEADALVLGDVFNTPTGDVIAAGVGAVIPPAYAFDFKLFVDALKLASLEQQRIGQQRAGKLAVAAIAVFALLIILGD